MIVNSGKSAGTGKSAGLGKSKSSEAAVENTGVEESDEEDNK